MVEIITSTWSYNKKVEISWITYDVEIKNKKGNKVDIIFPMTINGQKQNFSIRNVPNNKVDKLLNEMSSLSQNFDYNDIDYNEFLRWDIKNETKEKLSKNESQLTGANLKDIWVLRSDALKFAKEELKISDPFDIKNFQKTIEAYQKSHFWPWKSVDWKIGKETFMEMKAWVVLEKARKWTNILPATQKEILFVLENWNPKGSNFIWKNGLYNFLCNFRKNPTGNKDYTDFFLKLDIFFKNWNSYTKHIEKEIKSWKWDSGTMYQRWKKIIMNENLTPKEKTKAIYDEFKGWAKILLWIAFLFGMFWSDSKMTDSWWKRALVLFWIWASGAFEALDDWVNWALDEDTTLEKSVATWASWSNSITNVLKEWTWASESDSIKWLNELESKLKIENNKNWKDKLWEDKLHTLLEVFSWNKALLDKKVSELQWINSVPSSFLIDAENQKLTKSKIDEKDLKKFINILQKEKKNDNQTLWELIKSFIPEKTKVEKFWEEVDKIDVNSFTTISLIEKQIKDLDEKKTSIEWDTSISISEQAKFIKKYDSIKLKLIIKGAQIEKDEWIDWKYTKLLKENKLLKEIIKSKEKFDENNKKVKTLLEDMNKYNWNPREKLIFYTKQLEQIKTLLWENNKELIKYDLIKDNSLVKEMVEAIIKTNNELADFTVKLKTTLSEYFKNLKTKEKEISTLSLWNLEQISQIKSFLDKRKNDKYTILAKQLWLEVEEIKASDLLIKLEEKKKEILEMKLSELPKTTKKLKELKLTLEIHSSDPDISKSENVLYDILTEIIDSDYSVENIIDTFNKILNDKKLKDSTENTIKAFLKLYFNNLK